jgi:hypothetical protein
MPQGGKPDVMLIACTHCAEISHLFFQTPEKHCSCNIANPLAEARRETRAPNVRRSWRTGSQRAPCRGWSHGFEQPHRSKLVQKSLASPTRIHIWFRTEKAAFGTPRTDKAPRHDCDKEPRKRLFRSRLRAGHEIARAKGVRANHRRKEACRSWPHHDVFERD